MKVKFIVSTFSLLITLMICQNLIAQNSVLVNFGSSNCNSIVPSFSMIKNPLGALPSVVAGCDFSQQVPNYSFVFIAYNPKNNQLYIADNRTGIETKIWQLNIGLPGNINCPAAIPLLPTYSYSYISNNFEFDNNGDLWSFSNYNSSTGQCNIDKFDVATGNVISTKTLQFPAGNFPTIIASGDLTILPNGRMFACLGNGTCRLYEITNYNSPGGIATATYLQTLPKVCYGIAYLNGIIEVTGADFNGTCYYYDYNIATNILGAEKSFQNAQSPIDNSSFTPSVGSTKRLLSATKINSNTADLVYEVYEENLGNVILNNVNVTDDLGAAFGATNVSNVSVAFVAGSNAAGLILNPAYNGTTVTSILNAAQNLPNNILSDRNYFFKLEIKCRVTNLNASTTYFNSAIAKGDIGGNNIASLVTVADSSNNGDSTVIDPNKNGNAGDVGENIPTPFVFGLLPVKFINVDALLINKSTAVIKWQVATPTVNAAVFEIEFSKDARSWAAAGVLVIDNANRGNYQFSHSDVPAGNLYYRIKQTDNDGTFVYSKIVLLHNKTNDGGYIIYPNPANNYIAISAGYNAAGKAEIELYDATGRKLLGKKMTASTEEINTAQYPKGAYLLKIFYDGNIITHKVIILH